MPRNSETLVYGYFDSPVLRYFSDLDYEAIGQAIGVSRSQVGTLLFRAKRMLREAMQVASPTEGRR